MKKIFTVVIGLVLVGAIALGGTSYYFGIQAEQEYRALLQQGSQSGVIKLTNESYQRGVFSSTARTAGEIRDPASTDKSAGEPVRFTLEHDIQHGPLTLGATPTGTRSASLVLGTIDTRLVLSPEIKTQIQAILGKPLETALLENHTTLFLGGNGESHFVIPAFHQTVGTDDKVVVNWDGLNLQMAYTANFKGFTGTMKAPSLEVVRKDGDFKMKNLESSFDMQEGLAGVPLGKGTFQLAHVEFTGKGDSAGQNFSLKSLKMESSSQAAGDDINHVTAVRVDQVAAGADQYGPGVFELALRKLDAASMAKLQQVARQMQNQSAAPVGSDDNSPMLGQLMDIFDGLLKKSPEIEITQLNVKTSKGDLQGKAKVVFDGTKGASVNNPLTLLNAVSAQAEISVGERLAQEIAAPFNTIAPIDEQSDAEKPDGNQATPGEADSSKDLLEDLVAQNLIVHQDGKYTASASYQQGNVILNGRPIPLQNLLQ